MKRLAGAVLGMVVAAGLAATALAIPPSETYTRPMPPPREVLDRLNLQMGWRMYVPMAGRQDGLFSVQLQGTSMFVQTRSGLILLLDADTGEVRWRARVGIPFRTSQPLAFNSREIYVLNNTYLYALDRNTGALHWQFHLKGGVAAPPLADENFLFIAAPSGRLSAYYLPRADVPVALPGSAPPTPPPSTDGKSGKEDKAPKKEDMPPKKEELPARPDLGPKGPVTPTTGMPPPPAIVSVKGDTRKTTGAIGYLSESVREASEAEEVGPRPVRVWQDVTSLRLDLPMLLTRDALTVPSPAGIVLTVAKLPGERSAAQEKYRFNTESAIPEPAGQFEDTAYIGARDANLYALQIPNGKLQWRYTAGTPIVRKPAVTDQDIYVVAERNGMARIDRATGLPMWRIPTRNGILENNPEADRFLAVNPKYLYAADRTGRLLVIDRQRGIRLSYYDTRDFVFPISNEVTDRLYLAANNGLIVCLHDREYQVPVRHRKAEDDTTNPVKLQLAQKVTDLGTSPMALREVLAYLLGKRGIKFRIAEIAYQQINRPSPAETLAQVPPVQKERPLGDILTGVLAAPKINSLYQVIGDTVVILPRGEKPAPPPAKP